jgi:hypothetical protein
MEPAHPLDTLGETSPREPTALIVFDMDVVKGLSPVMTDEHLRHRSPLVVIGWLSPRRPAARERFSAPGTSSHQLSKADLTNQQAHDLDVELEVRLNAVLTRWRLGTILTRSANEMVDPH